MYDRQHELEQGERERALLLEFQSFLEKNTEFRIGWEATSRDEGDYMEYITEGEMNDVLDRFINERQQKEQP